MFEDAVDIIVPPAPGSLMRAVQLWQNGLFRLARRECELYSVQITSSGAWATLRVYNALGRRLFVMPSTFTGSFWLSAHAELGLLVELYSKTMPPTITANFRERDGKLV